MITNEEMTDEMLDEYSLLKTSLSGAIDIFYSIGYEKEMPLKAALDLSIKYLLENKSEIEVAKYIGKTIAFLARETNEEERASSQE